MDAQFQIISLLHNFSKKASCCSCFIEYLFMVSWPSGNTGRTDHSNKVNIHLQQLGTWTKPFRGLGGLQEGWLRWSRQQNCPDTVAFFTHPWCWTSRWQQLLLQQRAWGLLVSFFLIQWEQQTQLAGPQVCAASSSPCFPYFPPIYFPTYVLPLRYFSNQYFNILIAV